MRPAGPGETGISRSIILIRWRERRVTQPVLSLSPLQVLPQRRRLAGTLEIASPRRAQAPARASALVPRRHQSTLPALSIDSAHGEAMAPARQGRACPIAPSCGENSAPDRGHGCQTGPMPVAPIASLWHGARRIPCRRSSGVEHALGKGGVEGSIPSGGTINPLKHWVSGSSKNAVSADIGRIY